jgi:hypothetical protein
MNRRSRNTRLTIPTGRYGMQQCGSGSETALKLDRFGQRRAELHIRSVAEALGHELAMRARGATAVGGRCSASGRVYPYSVSFRGLSPLCYRSVAHLRTLHGLGGWARAAVPSLSHSAHLCTVQSGILIAFNAAEAGGIGATIAKLPAKENARSAVDWGSVFIQKDSKNTFRSVRTESARCGPEAGEAGQSSVSC